MNDFVRQYFAATFPIFFVVLWVGGTSLVGLISGWYALMTRFPDQTEEPILLLRLQSGTMRFVRMNNILTLSVCPSGFRIGIPRLFGPFSRNIFVPWESITATRRTNFLSTSVRLSFGDPVAGWLGISPRLAERLAGAAGKRWPELN
jgi:hypothetical protein